MTARVLRTTGIATSARARARPRAILPALLALLTLARTAHAGPDSGKCIDEAERGQALRGRGEFEAAREALLVCAAETCPAVIQHDCVGWLADVDARTPTVIFSAKTSSGKDVPGATIVIDGGKNVSATSGRAIRLDPGEHVFRARSGESNGAEEYVVLREREKDRAITLVVDPARPTTSPASVPASSRAIPALSWILGGVSLASLGVFAFAWADGVSTIGDLEDTCAPRCTDAQVDDARGPLRIGRVALGVSVVTAAAAAAVYFLTPPKPSPSTTASAGAAAGVRSASGSTAR